MTKALTREDLVAAAQRGDEAALLQLLRACRPDLTRYARRTCQSDDVEEAVQDALWLLYRRAGALRVGAALSAWMFQVVKRTCLRVMRRRQAWQHFAPAPIAEDHPTPAEEEGLRLDLARALTRLPPAYREVLILRDIHGFEAAEAAAVLGLTVEATKSRLHRARAAMRAQLQVAAPRARQPHACAP